MISIIVPVYNIKTEYLKACIESILQQDYQNWELLLINDGSTNGCGLICEEYAQKDTRIQTLTQENAGVSVARNNGILNSAGDFLMFVDADDLLAEGILSQLIKNIEKNPVDLLLFGYQTEYQNRSVTRICQNEDSSLFLKESLELAILQGDARLGAVEVGTPWGKLIKRSIVIENQVLFTQGLKKGQDTVFILQLLEFCDKIAYLPVVGYCYRISGTSISKRYNDQIVSIMEKTLAEYQKFVLNNHPDQKFISAVKKKYLRVVLGEYMLLYFANSHNPKSYRQKKTEWIQLLNREPYAAILGESRVRGTGILEQLRFFCVEKKFFGMIYCLQLMENKVRDLLIQKYE